MGLGWVRQSLHPGSSGMLAGVGIDILEVARMERELQRSDGGLCDAVFTDRELLASQQSRYPARYLAACFASKEALFKALGTGWTQGLAWKEVETDPVSGRIEMRLTGRVAAHAEQIGVRAAWASWTHTATFAVASVVLERSHPVQ